MGNKVAILRARSAVSSFRISMMTLFSKKIARMIPGGTFTAENAGLPLRRRGRGRGI